MNYLYLLDQAHQQIFEVRWAPGPENIVNYHTEKSNSTHNSYVIPYYLHLWHFTIVLPKSKAPSTLRGCAKTTLAHDY